MAKVKVYVVEGPEALEVAIQQAIDNEIHVLPFTQDGNKYTLVTVGKEPAGRMVNVDVPDGSKQ
jgi:hypothetical protein